MPLLAALLPALAAFIGKIFATMLALRVAGVLALVAASGALLLVYNTTIAPLAAAAFATDYGQFLGLIFPPISGTCLAAIATVWSACALYGLQKRAIVATAHL